ncbi:MAG: tetratricopeptide repeat protein [bacterium]
MILAIAGLGIFLYINPQLLLFLPISNDVSSSNDRLQLDSPFPPPQKPGQRATITFEDFTGSQACAECHAEQFQVWQKSTHGRAGGDPKKVAIIGRYNQETLQYKDARVFPTKNDSGEYFFKVEQENRPVLKMPVDAVVGGGHMLGGGTQSYFTKFPDGTLRFVPFDFIKQEGVWFSQRRDNRNWDPDIGKLALNELSEWPPNRILGTNNDFSNCQNCHGSQILVDFDPQRKRYLTRYTELAINCESCHGPGKRHIDIIKVADADSLPYPEDIGMSALETLLKDASLRVCFQCHAVKDALDESYLPGIQLEHYYALKLPILAQNPYLADGRVLAFAYQQNHLASDCYLNGSMTCVDCHDPHSQKYRDIAGNTLIGVLDDRQCTDCHPSKTEKPEKHSFHKPDSPGSQCISCHSPYLQHKMLGKKLRFARSDHTYPIPRPAFDAALGIEDACSKCHKDKSVQWLQAKTDAWYGEIKPHKAIVKQVLEAEQGKFRNRQEAAANLLAGAEFHPLAQMAALSYFIKTYLLPDMPILETKIVEQLKSLAAQPDLDLKSLALMSLHLTRGQTDEMRGYLREQLENLGESEVAVRARWAIGIDFLGFLYGQKRDFANAIRAHKKALQVRPADPVGLVNLGLAYGNSGDLERAIAAFQKALEVDSTYSLASKNMGFAYLQQGDFVKAIKSYKKATEMKPFDPGAYLLLAQAHRRAGQHQDAIAVLNSACELLPYDESILQALQQFDVR